MNRFVRIDRLPEYAGEGEIRLEVLNFPRALVINIVAICFVCLLLAGWTAWEGGLEPFLDLARRGWRIPAAILVAILAFLTIWDWLERGAWRTIVLRETELVLTPRSGPGALHVAWHRIQDARLSRNRLATRLILKVDSRAQPLKISAPPFAAGPLTALHATLTTRKPDPE